MSQTDISVIDSDSRIQQAEKNVKALNSQFSLLRDFITFVGSSHSDSSVIREEIMRLRTNIRNCAFNVENELSFCMSCESVNKRSRSGKSKTIYSFLTCLQLIISELRKMRYLQRTFPHVNSYDENQSTVLGTLVLRHSSSNSAKIQTRNVNAMDSSFMDSDIRCLMNIMSNFNQKLKDVISPDANLRPGFRLSVTASSSTKLDGTIPANILPSATKRKFDNFRLGCLCCRIFSPSYI